jgi:hypothetical protein
MTTMMKEWRSKDDKLYFRIGLEKIFDNTLFS